MMDENEKKASEEEKVIQAEMEADNIIAYRDIPYGLISQELSGNSNDVLAEFNQIRKYYRIYSKGIRFIPEGSNGDYMPARLPFKTITTLINKEARFLFAESPSIYINPKGDAGKVSDEAKDALTTVNDLVTTILEENRFEQAIIKAAKDCFIGKRVAALLNFNEDDGVTITFLPATQFVWENKLGNPNILTKFVAFIVVQDSTSQTDQRIFKKKFEMDDDGNIYIEEILYDGGGAIIQEVTPRQRCEINFIPAVIILNDGLTGDMDGESEIEELKDYEKWYSKLANSDIDALRKSMNPTRYVVDMDSNSTKNLSTAAGALWDLGSDQNLDKPSPKVGLLEPNMNYSESLKSSLDRLKTTEYEQIDIPNITLETMIGSITSGKALKAIYWPLIVRCKEKMKTWGPALQKLIDMLIQGSYIFPNTVSRYITDPLTPVAYQVSVEQNLPLQEDEQEEKQIDLAEVTAQTMSRKSYMKKWRDLTDDEVEDELEQIAIEREMIEDSVFSNARNQENQDDLPYPDAGLGYEEKTTVETIVGTGQQSDVEPGYEDN